MFSIKAVLVWAPLFGCVPYGYCSIQKLSVAYTV